MLFHFQGGCLEPSRNRLTVDGEEKRLEPKLVDVLVCLIERAGEVVPKTTLLSQVWRGASVSDDALTAAIYALRKALGDSARQPRFIETVPQRGYQWLLEVRHESRSGTTGAQTERAGRPSRIPSPPIALRQGARLLERRAFARARTFLERATEAQPENAEAQASLSLLYSQLAALKPDQRLDFYYKARLHAERALAVDPHGAQTLLARGLLTLIFDWDLVLSLIHI